LIIQVRGNHGSGKSTVVRNVLAQLKGTPIYGLLGPNRPEAYRCDLKPRPLYVLGPYQSSASSGCDLNTNFGCDYITKRGVKTMVACLEKYSLKGNVLFESILTSTRFMEPSVGAWLLKHRADLLNVTLTTTLDQCIEAVTSRQTRSIVAGTRSLGRESKHIHRQQIDVERVSQKLTQLGFRVEYVSREDAVRKVLSWLKERAMKIEVYMDYVLIEGQRVNRPMRIARSNWMRYWEHLSWRD
jgi:cytidylate kinase